MFCLSKGFRIQRFFQRGADGKMGFPKTVRSQQAPPRGLLRELVLMRSNASARVWGGVAGGASRVTRKGPALGQLG